MFRTRILVVITISAAGALVALAQQPTPPAAPAVAPTLPFSGQHGTFGSWAHWPGDHEGFMKAQQLQSESAELAKKYIKTEKTAEKQDIRKKLGDLLIQQFDMHMKQQEKELASLEKEIASLKEVMKKRQDTKGAIVERRIDQLIQDAEGLGWNASGHAGGQPYYFNLGSVLPPAPSPTPKVGR